MTPFHSVLPHTSTRTEPFFFLDTTACLTPPLPPPHTMHKRVHMHEHKRTEYTHTHKKPISTPGEDVRICVVIRGDTMTPALLGTVFYLRDDSMMRPVVED